MDLLATPIEDQLRADLSREVILGANETYEQAFLSAARAVSGLDLNGRRLARSAGLVRAQIVEEGFEKLHAANGGQLLPEGLIPGTVHRLFQPYGQYGETLLGFGTMARTHELPKGNLTRKRTALLNEPLEPGLFAVDVSALPIKRCALILTAKAPGVISEPEEIAIAVVSPDYQRFLFYQRLDAFLMGYKDGSGSAEPDRSGDGPTPGLRLRRKPAAVEK